ncbi:MAG TPA: hypothetical protein VI756_10660, partial [Blastocatellia bacterium]
MNKKLAVKLFVLSSAAALLVVSAVQARHQPTLSPVDFQAQQQPGAAPHGPPPEPKNLLVFKGLNHDQVIAEMRKMT